MSDVAYLRPYISQLPQNVLEQINETLNSDVPILVSKWTDLIDDQPCGCLLADGLAQRDRDLWEQLNAGEDTADILFSFYGLQQYDPGYTRMVEDDDGDEYEEDIDEDDRLGAVPGFELYIAYDRWARDNHYVVNQGPRYKDREIPQSALERPGDNSHYWKWTLSDEGREILKAEFAQELINRQTA